MPLSNIFLNPSQLPTLLLPLRDALTQHYRTPILESKDSLLLQALPQVLNYLFSSSCIYQENSCLLTTWNNTHSVVVMAASIYLCLSVVISPWF